MRVLDEAYKRSMERCQRIIATIDGTELRCCLKRGHHGDCQLNIMDATYLRNKMKDN